MLRQNKLSFKKRTFLLRLVCFLNAYLNKSKKQQIFTDQVKNDQVRDDRVRYDRVRYDWVRNYRVRNNQVRSDRFRNDRVRYDRVINDHGLEIIVNRYSILTKVCLFFFPVYRYVHLLNIEFYNLGSTCNIF